MSKISSTSAPTAAAAYESDPMPHPKISAKLLGTMPEAIDFSQFRAALIIIPTPIVVAGDDRPVDAAGADSR